MKWILAIAALLVMGAAGMVAGMALRPLPPPAPTPRMLEVREVAAPAAPGLDGAQLASLVRSVVREEIDRAVPRAAAGEREKEQPRPEPTDEQLEAHDRGQSLIAGAQRIGHWTDEDRERFREILRQVSAAERSELLHTLIPAINRQEVKVDTIGPPF